MNCFVSYSSSNNILSFLHSYDVDSKAGTGGFSKQKVIDHILDKCHNMSQLLRKSVLKHFILQV